MDVTGEFVLASNVALIDAPLAPGKPCCPGLAVSTAPAGEVTFVDDMHIVRLIARFRTPTTICDAIWETATELRQHPELILDGCYPAIRRLIESGYIVAAGTRSARAPQAEAAQADPRGRSSADRVG